MKVDAIDIIEESANSSNKELIEEPLTEVEKEE